MEESNQDDLSNLPGHDIPEEDVHMEDLPLEDNLPLEEATSTTEREIISQSCTQEDEMPDVIVTELRSWKNECQRHGPTRHYESCRIDELARPKVNHQLIVDRPSVYWTDKIPEDTTLSVTFPIMTPRLEELSRPKRFYSTYYNESRSTPIWPISRSSLEAKASPRLKLLAYPKIRNNIWVIDQSKVSKAAQVARPRPRTLELAIPKTKSQSPAEMARKTSQSPDLDRIYTLATPKTLSSNYVYDKPCSWEVSEVTKHATVSKRILHLAKPKERKDCNEGHDPYCISVAALKAEASPRLYELATPKRVTKKF